MSGMINRDGLLALYTYNAYANELVLDTIEKLTEKEFTQKCSPSHGSVHELLNHILECEAYFLAQCRGLPVAMETTDLTTVASIRQYSNQLQQDQHDFIQSLNDVDLARDIELTLGKSQLVFPVWQLLLQALIHSVHHRGELSIILTELGYPLPTLDVILQFIKQSGQSWQPR